jgi:methyl-accepting chemotaxis protein
MKFTIGKRLGMGFGLCIAVIIVLVTYNYIQLNRLQTLQSEGADRAKDAIVVSEAAGMGQKLYQVVADAVIGRNLKEAQRDWSDVKDESVADLDNVAKHSVSDQEKAWAAEAQKALTALVSLFEDELMPVLQSGNPSAARIQELDDQIDAQVDAMGKPLSAILESVQKRSDEADKIYASIGQSVILISLVLSIAGLIAAAAVAFFITRAITVPLGAMAAAARKIAAGEVNQNVEHRSSDETGDLAQAFRECIEYIKGIASAADVLSHGDLTARVVAKSERDVLSQNFMRLIDCIKGVIAEVDRLVKAANEGQLQTRADAARFHGAYRELVAGMNGMMDAMVAPINEASDVLEKVAAQDLSVRMQGNYRGDFAKIKESLNTAVNNLDRALLQVAVAVEQVNSAAGQISEGSQSLAQGASEQASSLEEVSSSLQEMSSMTKQNAGNAREARSLSDAARGSTDKGVQSMERLSAAINKIKDSSDRTAKIVKTIDEIAFQTNLLALNAAVEAARAGDAGKGFAVVAEEVRNLAMRSAEAAKSTANLIEESVNNAEGGVEINQEVLRNLMEINQQVNKVTEVVSEIAAASEQQSQGVEQINTAIDQMNQVTQQTAANSEESASAAEELSGQAAEMKNMVRSFRLSEAHNLSTQGTEVHRRIITKPATVRPLAAASKPKALTNPKDLIPLENSEQGVLQEF